MVRSNYGTLILDLENVVTSLSEEFNITASSSSKVSFKRLRASLSWMDYERGKIPEIECYERLSEQYYVQQRQLVDATSKRRASLQCDKEILSLLRHLKSEVGGKFRIVAMSNMPMPDYLAIRASYGGEFWLLFDDVFTSAALGVRKPNLGFYRHVLNSIGTVPQETVFVDNEVENVLSARSLGMHGLVFDTGVNAARTLRNLFGDPIARGSEFLGTNAGLLFSVTDCNVAIQDNFAQLLILEATKDPNLVVLTQPQRTWNFFNGKPLFTTETYPDDLDTTSLALSILKPDEKVIHSIMDEILEHVDEDGIVMVHFDKSKQRVDPVVCTNVLTLFNQYQRGEQLHRTLSWIRDVLFYRAYLDGTLYYITPEWFLFFVHRLINFSNNKDIREQLGELLKERIQERTGAHGDALSLAMRIIICNYMGVPNFLDLSALLACQCQDGGWEAGQMYRLVRAGKWIGNRGVTTAFALNAIKLAYA